VLYKSIDLLKKNKILSSSPNSCTQTVFEPMVIAWIAINFEALIHINGYGTSIKTLIVII